VRLTWHWGSRLWPLGRKQKLHEPGTEEKQHVDPDIIRGIERVTGETYAGDGQWMIPAPREPETPPAEDEPPALH
jgi:hypothetical protein